MSKQRVTSKQIEKSLKPSKLRAFFNKNLTKRFKKDNCQSCAIARYLRDEFKVGPKSVDVHADDVTVKGTNYWTPEWVGHFIHTFDDERTKYVTGKKALEILLGVAYRKA